MSNRLVNFLQEDLNEMENILNLFYSTTSRSEDRKTYSYLLDKIYYWQQHSNSFKENEDED